MGVLSLRAMVYSGAHGAKRASLVPALAALFMAFAIPAHAEQGGGGLEKVKSMAAAADFAPTALSFERQQEYLGALLGAGGDAVSHFTASLKSGNEREKFIAAHALAYLGGRQAVDALMEEVKAGTDVRIKCLLLFAMGSTGSPEDIGYLIESLKSGGAAGERWEPMSYPKEQAAWTLGALGAGQAKEQLAAMTKAGSAEGLSIMAAGYALGWMDKPFAPLTLADGLENDKLIEALVEFGMAEMDLAAGFDDRARGMKITKDGKKWKIEKGSSGGDLPVIQFSISAPKDGTAAVVDIAIWWSTSPLVGSGYHYKLEKRDGQWRLSGVLHKWIN